MPPNCTNLQLHITSQPFLDGTNHKDISQECNELSDPSDDDYDLGPEIYDDFVLLPPRPATRAIHASPSSIPSRIRTPYLPPEIIGLICLFSSPRTVVHSIQRVCRDWHAVSLLYIGQKGLWRFRSQREEDELLDKLRLGRTNTLIILHESTPSLWRQRLDRTPPYDLWWPALNKFWRAVTVSSLEQDEDSSTTSTPVMELQSHPIAASSLIQNIGKLVLQGQYTCDSTSLLPMLPHLGRIHTLELAPVQYSRIPLFPILEHCLRLENLTIRSQQIDSMKIVWTIEDPGLETHLLGWTSSRLTYFDAIKVSTTYGVLSNLIGFCHDLRSLKVQDFYLEFPPPPLYPMRPPEQATILAQIRPLYGQAALQCPNLEEFSVVPVLWSRLSSEGHNHHSYSNHVYEDKTHHSAHMSLVHEFFPHLRQATFTLTMPSPWQPTPALCDYLSRLTHLHVTGNMRHSCFNSQALDVVLRCARSLVTLMAPEVNVRNTKFFHDQEVAKEFEALLAAKGISPGTKRARILYKRLNWEAARKYNAPIHHDPSPHHSSLPHPIHWACRDLQVVDIGVGLGVSGSQVQDAEAVLRQLAHCCPLIVDLTIRSSGLSIGQQVNESKYGYILEDESLLKQAVIRRRGQAVEDPLLSCAYYNIPEGYKYGSKIVCSRAQNVVLALGGGHRYEDFDGGIGASWQDMSMLTQGKLTRLRQLCFVVQAIQGELSVGEFEFLRTKNDARDRKHVKRAPKEVYWPRLEMFSILYQTAPTVVPTPFDKIDAKDSRPLVKKLQGLRPGVFFKVAHNDSV